MKTLLSNIALHFSWLFAATNLQGQGVLYVSNLGETAGGAMAVASNSWIAQLFVSGSNPQGYLLNSIQLLMNPASGNPSGFAVSIYSADGNGNPGTLLGNLFGDSNPMAGGVFSYSASEVKLSPITDYFVSVTAATSVGTGAYSWSLANTTSDTTFGDPRWAIYELYDTSLNGVDWTHFAGQNPFQMAIYATAIPEPSVAFLVFLGGGVLIFLRVHLRRTTR